MGRGKRSWRRSREGNSTIQSLCCGILAKKMDTTHFQDEDQAAASVYSTASDVFNFLDAILKSSPRPQL